MILIAYDIRDDRLRNKLSKFIQQYGRRIQYSVYEIKNSERILNNIKVKIQIVFEKKFSQSDSVYIFHLSKNCKIDRFGYAKNEETDLLIY